MAVVDANVAVKWFVADQELEAQAFAVREEYDCWAPASIVIEIAIRSGNTSALTLFGLMQRRRV